MKKQTIHFSMPHHSKQTGAVMAISLIILLLLTLIGVTGMRSTLMQERMAGNDRDRNQAFQLAEAGLRDGEAYLSLPVVGTFSTTVNSNGRYVAKTDGTSWWNNSAVWSGSAGSVAGSLSGVKYIVEELQTIIGSEGSLEAGLPGLSKYYRITARGESGNSSAVVILQSVYKR